MLRKVSCAWPPLQSIAGLFELVSSDQLFASPAPISVWLPDDCDCAALAGHQNGNIPANLAGGT
jgi:hypothetical protein